jgi:hypothetical protein
MLFFILNPKARLLVFQHHTMGLWGGWRRGVVVSESRRSGVTEELSTTPVAG